MNVLTMLIFLAIFSSNPVGRPRKKDKKEKKMNVDFSNDTLQLSMQSDSEHAYQMPRPELVQANSSFLSEDIGNSSATERIAMPKRPHNVIFDIIYLLQIINSLYLQYVNASYFSYLFIGILLLLSRSSFKCSKGNYLISMVVQSMLFYPLLV